VFHRLLDGGWQCHKSDDAWRPHVAPRGVARRRQRASMAGSDVRALRSLPGKYGTANNPMLNWLEEPRALQLFAVDLYGARPMLTAIVRYTCRPRTPGPRGSLR
jgi:hypothetical protein